MWVTFGVSRIFPLRKNRLSQFEHEIAELGIPVNDGEGVNMDEGLAHQLGKQKGNEGGSARSGGQKMRRSFGSQGANDPGNLPGITQRFLEMPLVDKIDLFIFELGNGLLVAVGQPKVVEPVVELIQVGHLLEMTAAGAHEAEFDGM